MGRHRSGYISIDVSDYISEISDDDLVQEVKDRKLMIGGGVYEPIPEDEIRKAYVELLANRPCEAKAILERLICPKWGSIRGCEIDYKSARLALPSEERQPE